MPVFFSSMAGILPMISTTSPVSLAAPMSPLPVATIDLLAVHHGRGAFGGQLGQHV